MDKDLARDLLVREVEAFEQMGHPECVTMKRWLLDNGETCGPRVSVRGLPLMAKKQCYQNSLKTIMFHEADPDEWFYTEGVVASDALPLLIDHAWLTNRKGEVLDRTLRRKDINGKDRLDASYYGIPFTNEFALKATLEHGYYGLFSNGAVYNRDVVGQPLTGKRAWQKSEA